LRGCGSSRRLSLWLKRLISPSDAFPFIALLFFFVAVTHRVIRNWRT